MFGIDKTTSKRVVFSEDAVVVHVVKLEGIKIRAPVHLVASGTELPLHAVGLDGDNQVIDQVLIVRWSACLPFIPTIRVRIQFFL